VSRNKHRTDGHRLDAAVVRAVEQRRGATSFDRIIAEERRKAARRAARAERSVARRTKRRSRFAEKRRATIEDRLLNNEYREIVRGK
jgi:hypothetical protein